MNQTELVWRTLFVTALGGAGIYLMLPRARAVEQHLQRWLGSALATLALVLLATFPVSRGLGDISGNLFSPLADWTSHFVFYVLAFVSIASAALMITSRNPVYSALWFALVLLSNSGLYLLQQAEFLAAATIIIYAGAIIVTFLFVIMLAQPMGAAAYDRITREPKLATLSGVLLATTLLVAIHYAVTVESGAALAGSASTMRPAAATVTEVLQAGPAQARINPAAGHVASLGKTLFLDHVVSVEVIGLLLLAAVVGAMLIVGHRAEPR